MKKVLITGANSYIGDSFKKYLEEVTENSQYTVDILDTVGLTVKSDLFFGYNVVFNVAGIAHIRETDENRHLYDMVNHKLSIEIAKAAKEAGVDQFILLSTMSVYGKVTGHILKSTRPAPTNAYGISKLKADEAIVKLDDDQFKVAILRPPMVYGNGCKGNYQSLRKLTLLSPVFPAYKNKRSMIFIGNLCEFVKRVIDSNASGLFFPQNKEYVSTRQLVKNIAMNNGKQILVSSVFNFAVHLFSNMNVVKKVFGNLTYEKVDTVSLYDFETSIALTEKS
ncbi:TPA: NAD-dependent epimerase/dehydratase family protein [Streptococcus suis]|nr:NAD-dependent epimerase/dehydratase family protein [Streptococcus suis]